MAAFTASLRSRLAWTYAVLTAIIFCETGLIVTPFLPGDSLLFATGALAATGVLDVWLLFFLLTAAAIVGDAVNYWTGKFIGTKLFDGRIPYLKQEHLDRTHAFYEKYGGKAIVALPSWHPKAAVSTVVPRLAGPVTSFQHSYLVSEQGAATIWGHDAGEQAQQIIDHVAHPRVRAELTEAGLHLGFPLRPPA